MNTANRFLIVAATDAEIAPLLDKYAARIPNTDVLITGVGIAATSFALGGCLATHQYDLIINAGIAGCFDREIALGSVVSVFEDTFSELGAEDGDEFLTVKSLGFGENTLTPPAPTDHLILPLDGLLKVKGITVNCVHGNDLSIQAAIQRFNPTVESMEGAAVFYASLQTGIPAIQIRAISNYVEKRNRANWQVGLAISHLNCFLMDMISAINQQI
ncbi:futalosine hydrolase [bacterium A37T11]|nr:futalosine hydrolase [bacterium A37T11]